MAFRSLDDMYDKWDKTAKGVGNPDDAEVPSGDGSSIGILKAVRTMVSSALVTLGSAIGSKGQLVAGSDGANARAIKTAADGTVLTQLTGSIVAEGNPAPDVGMRYTVAASTVSTVIDTTTPGVIDYIYVVVDDKQTSDVRVGLSRYDSIGNLRSMTRYNPHNEGVTPLQRLQISHVVEMGRFGPWLALAKTSADKRSMMTIDPIMCPYGFQLTIENVNATTQRYVYPVVYWRQMQR